MQASVQARYVLSWMGPYLSRIGMDQRDQSIYGIRKTGPTFLSTYTSHQAHKLMCMHPMCLCAQANISVKLGRIREIKVSMESGEHVGPLWAHNLTQAHKLACMHTIGLHVQAYISAKFGQIREIKVSMDSGEYAVPLWAQNLTQACKLACMNAMCLHAQTHISAKLGWIREIKVSMESG